MLTNSKRTYEMLQPFATIEQLNANTRAIRAQYSEILTPLTKKVLDVIHRYASKYYGVCFLAKTKIAEMIGASRRTVIRACQQLEALGCIVQYETKRINGDKRQSSNAIVFLTQISAREAFVDDIEKPSDNMKNDDDTPNGTADVTPNTLSNNAQKTINNTDDTEKASLLKSGLVSKLPQTLQYALAPFFNAEELYELAGVVYKAKASVDKSIRIEDNEKDYYNAILSVINAFKRGKVRNLPSLIYHAVKATTRSIWLRERSAAMFGLYA